MDASTQALFGELKDVLDNYSDVWDGPNGPLPNKAMTGLGLLAEIEGRYEAVLQAAETDADHFDRIINDITRP